MVFPAKFTFLVLVIGAILTFFGRRVYLISIGILGFLGGLYLFMLLNGSIQDWKAMLVALLMGVAGTLLAYFVQRAAWVFGGFFGGGILLFYLNDSLRMSPGISPPVLFLAGGVAGAIIFTLMMDWALIILSSLTGAFLITYQIGLTGLPAQVVLIALAFLGIVVQRKSFRVAGPVEKKG